MSKRSIYLDTSYHMSWGLLDSVSDEEIAAEIPAIEKKLHEIYLKEQELSRKSLTYRSRLNCLKETLERREWSKMYKEFVLTEAHKKIINEINWLDKDPYNNLEPRHVCELMNWKKPNDDYSDEQYEKAKRLLKEIPIAVEKFFGKKSDKKDV